MCGRVFVRTTLDELIRNFAWAQAAGGIEGLANDYPRWNGAPGKYYPLIIQEPDRAGPVFMRASWGFTPSWANGPNLGGRRPPINARAETVATSGMFKHAYRRRRALMPIDGFFEWWDVQGTGKNKQPYAVAMKTDEPFCIAAIWEEWKNRQTDGVIRTFAVVTCEANELMATIHPRMPVIIAPEDYRRWLAFEQDDPHDLLKQFPSEKMKMWPIGRGVGNTRNNTPDVLDPIEVARSDEPEPPEPGTLL
ncbi:SOS response-associated peptidase [Chelativorans salis]|uniref:Abasic site processing protein n=1 Tax=Chelativorans salis TaxID=2978478 RepID=A0ABT2LUG3_9HYPH|nr:SOS response-associated peptidase [Chelativorans sp. EGI FJ00035]MCT7378176.1 SOS response-associated peptidase [Chelativorans sp. EGI FJ00035]